MLDPSSLPVNPTAVKTTHLSQRHSTEVRPIKADILVIDDTPENLHLLSTMLSERQYKVRSVTKGSTGLRGAIAAPPDLILLDINMPEMNGYEVCEQLKAHETTCDIPVIFISALGDVLDKVNAFNVGGVDFITKPFHVDEVLARIQTHLTLHRLQQQQQAHTLRLQQEIDNRRRAEETFKKSFNASPSPIAVTRLSDDTFIAVNPSFLRLSGYSQPEIMGKTTAELAMWQDQSHYQAAISQVSLNDSFDNEELEYKTRQGDLRIVLASIKKIVLDGEPCALTIINDITERKRLENEFISVVSHELRTPMHSLAGALDLLSTGELGVLTEQGQQILSVATTNAERLIRLVNDILDLERLKSGKMSVNRSNCNIANLVTQAVESMQAMADNAQVQLQVQSMSVPVTVDCDRILQTLTNLLSNAIKFSPAGGTVLLTVELDKPTLEEPASSNTLQTVPQLHITLSDQGRGIPFEQLETIFERFQQVDASDSRRKGGTGLGLAICRQILQQHGGRIWAESTLGQGSTFHVCLPTGSPV
ncbi:PAS fold family [Synechococcus sp. PCC 7335]|uniref:ATP-binding response regulator n=1 Tax=Synechococcus sp. (strain ATCC 29403 / PCC 7335) TaxID=91464 RepID=UPI00017EE7EA|nr:ATP-binding protein [Synechococcus sp. PCC 7335]EDX86569.1 PAS fold family [Synechococcus sp. PCC 7335]